MRVPRRAERLAATGPLACALAAVALIPAARAAGPGAGCDARRPAIAYHAGQGPLSPQPAGAPMPCAVAVSGRAGESATVAVTPSGRVLYAPLVQNDLPAPADDRGPAVVTGSDDGGGHWQTLDSGSPDHILDVPPWMSEDAGTGRIWFASVLPALCGEEISWSDDNGRTWQTNPLVGCPAMGSLRVMEGPPPAGGPAPAGYPHVVYVCANLSDFNTSTLWCYRSLDGGHSFSFTTGFPDPPPKPGCGTAHAARPGTVGADGDLYFPVYQCGELSVAISRDEGASWQQVPVGASPVQDLYITSMAADRAGNLFLAWIAGDGSAGGAPAAGGPSPATEGILGQGSPMLSVSRDRGATWSPPRAIGPPGTTAARHIAIAADGNGKVAVSFLASSDGGGHLNGYLAETPDALARDPLWWAASLDDPAKPLLSTADSETFGDRLFFFTDTFSPTGEPWAAFHCAKTSACPGRRVGIVGRLATAPASVAPRAQPVRFSFSARCASRRRLRVAVRAPAVGVRRASVFVDGRRARVVPGAALRAPLTVARVPHGPLVLRLSLELVDGRTLSATRAYRACATRRAATGRLTG